MENTILTYEEAKAKKLQRKLWENNIYYYQEKGGEVKLIINGVNKLDNKKAVRCHYYGNYGGHEVFKYQAEGDPYIKLMVGDRDVLQNKKATGCRLNGNVFEYYSVERCIWRPLKQQKNFLTF